jgi:hypothetical protein
VRTSAATWTALIGTTPGTRRHGAGADVHHVHHHRHRHRHRHRHHQLFW